MLASPNGLSSVGFLDTPISFIGEVYKLRFVEASVISRILPPVYTYAEPTCFPGARTALEYDSPETVYMGSPVAVSVETVNDTSVGNEGEPTGSVS